MTHAYEIVVWQDLFGWKAAPVFRLCPAMEEVQNKDQCPEFLFRIKAESPPALLTIRLA